MSLGEELRHHFSGTTPLNDVGAAEQICDGAFYSDEDLVKGLEICWGASIHSITNCSDCLLLVTWWGWWFCVVAVERGSWVPFSDNPALRWQWLNLLSFYCWWKLKLLLITIIFSILEFSLVAGCPPEILSFQAFLFSNVRVSDYHLVRFELFHWVRDLQSFY